jgi:hypothetical protein
MPGDVLGIDVDDYEYWYQERDPETNEPLYDGNGDPVMALGVKIGNVTLGGLEDELGPLPATWRSSSRGDGPSGIRFFKVPPGLIWGDLGLHLEGIWWGHRYAVVYPSINPDSEMQYKWINDADHEPRWGVEPPKVTDLLDLPESWVARFGRDASAPVVRTAASARAGSNVLPPTGDRKPPAGRRPTSAAGTRQSAVPYSARSTSAQRRRHDPVALRARLLVGRGSAGAATGRAQRHRVRRSAQCRKHDDVRTHRNLMGG